MSAHRDLVFWRQDISELSTYNSPSTKGVERQQFIQVQLNATSEGQVLRLGTIAHHVDQSIYR